MIKIIIDTNVYISFLIGKTLHGLHKALYSDTFKVIISNEQITELIDVFNRPKISKYIPKEKVSDFFDLLDEKSEIIEIRTLVDICRDPKDNFLLSMAIDSKADLLITGDKDLLEIQTIKSTKIVNYTDFKNLYLK